MGEPPPDACAHHEASISLASDKRGKFTCALCSLTRDSMFKCQISCMRQSPADLLGCVLTGHSDVA